MSTIDIEKTGKNIKDRMVIKGLSSQQLADYLSISISAVYHWLQGRKVPSIDNLILLSELFECSVDEIIEIKKVEL